MFIIDEDGELQTENLETEESTDHEIDPDADEDGEEVAADTEPKEHKSIIPAKYGKGYKGADDWMTGLFDKHCAASTESERTIKSTDSETGEVTEKTINTTKKITNIDSLFAFARANNVNVDKYEEQRDRHGFPGRFRMTVSNMLRAAAKKRHGVNTPDGVWNDAPQEWLEAKGAKFPVMQDQDGVAIVYKKEEEDEEA